MEAKINNWIAERNLKQNIKLEGDTKKKHTIDLLSSIKKQENEKNSFKELDTSSHKQDTLMAESEENDESLNPEEDETDKSEKDDSELIEIDNDLESIPKDDDNKVVDETAEGIEVGEMVTEKEVDLDSVEERKAKKRKYEKNSNIFKLECVYKNSFIIFDGNFL